MKDVTSKNIDGITDLVVVAPIKKGFIPAYENITYASRLKLASEALNRVRVAAREFERVTPFTDVTERILNLLDFRIGVLDKDVFGFVDKLPVVDEDAPEKELESRRFLYLTATFEGGWEPYMRLIWKPLGAFLDLLFCNCEGYVTATEHSCDEYLQWVRDNQIDTSIFYAVTGLTTRDERYLSRLERLQRAGPSDPAGGDLDLELATFSMPYPDTESFGARIAHGRKTLELGLEALTVLYKLADYYPPDWLLGDTGVYGMTEGHRLVRVAREILRGWDGFVAALEAVPDFKPALELAKKIYDEPLNWYQTGSAHIAKLDAQRIASRKEDPPFDRSEVQGGILRAQGSKEEPVRHGALLLFSIKNAEAARKFLSYPALGLHFEMDAAPAGGIYRNLALTIHAFPRIGMDACDVEQFPKEFREGMATRAGLMGDMRENHPRNWILPERNGPILTEAVPVGTRLPPVELDEVDFVIQLRSTDPNPEKIVAEVKVIAAMAAEAATLQAVEFLQGGFEAGSGKFRDHFGFFDGISQPRPILSDEVVKPSVPERDFVRAGEILLGYGNDRGDAAPGSYDSLDGWFEADPTNPNSKRRKTMTNWRREHRSNHLKLQVNGSYLVLRKIGENVTAFDKWLDQEAVKVAALLGCDTAEARHRIKAALMGRDDTGAPLVPNESGDLNDFDYGKDPGGAQCPFSAHIRRANPRRTVDVDKIADPVARAMVPHNTQAEFGRPTPRLVRRAMLFGGAGDQSQGLMFMAYNASISEQYETVQRWLNGGNSTDVFSGNNDPLTGVRPRDEAGHNPRNVFRFISTDRDGKQQVVRVHLPPAVVTGPNDLGRHPFTPVYWGLYLFVPSRSAIASLAAETGVFKAMRDPLEETVGKAWIERLRALPIEEAGNEWKRLLEDFVAKDPTEADISPNLWSAIRWNYGGAFDLRRYDKEPDALSSAEVPDNARRMFPGTFKGNFGDKMAGEFAEEDVAVQQVDATIGTADAAQARTHDWDNPDKSDQNVILCGGWNQAMQVLSEWQNFSVEEQLRRIIGNSGPIYVTQQPDNKYETKTNAYQGLNYHTESTESNRILLDYQEDQAFKLGYKAGQSVLDDAKAAVHLANQLAGPNSPPRDYFKLELRRQFIWPAIGRVWSDWYGIPDGIHLHEGGWSWKEIVEKIMNPDDKAVKRTGALCPGDFLSASRNSFYPRPGPALEYFADKQGTAILKAGLAFVKANRGKETSLPPLAQEMFKAHTDDEVLARNLIGTMIGAIPPMDANLRNILFDWLAEKSLWRHQAALRVATGGQSAQDNFVAANATLRGAITSAMCKRPAPDLLYRTAKRETRIEVGRNSLRSQNEGSSEVVAQPGDLVVVSLVSPAQRSLIKPRAGMPDGDVSIIFGGNRSKPNQGYIYLDGNIVPDPEAKKSEPVHACPAQKMAMGSMLGILAALLDAGTIQALPASLIVKISDWE